MLRLNVELGVQIALVVDLAASHREIARHRSDLEGVGTPGGGERPDRLVLLAHLARPDLSLQLNVRLARAEPDVRAHLQPEAVDPERVEKAILKFGPELLLP